MKCVILLVVLCLVAALVVAAPTFEDVSQLGLAAAASTDVDEMLELEGENSELAREVRCSKKKKKHDHNSEPWFPHINHGGKPQVFGQPQDPIVQWEKPQVFVQPQGPVVHAGKPQVYERPQYPQNPQNPQNPRWSDV